jgi:hypothetical protein
MLVESDAISHVQHFFAVGWTEHDQYDQLWGPHLWNTLSCPMAQMERRVRRCPSATPNSRNGMRSWQGIV